MTLMIHSHLTFLLECSKGYILMGFFVVVVVFFVICGWPGFYPTIHVYSLLVWLFNDFAWLLYFSCGNLILLDKSHRSTPGMLVQIITCLDSPTTALLELEEYEWCTLHPTIMSEGVWSIVHFYCFSQSRLTCKVASPCQFWHLAV